MLAMAVLPLIATSRPEFEDDDLPASAMLHDPSCNPRSFDGGGPHDQLTIASSFGEIRVKFTNCILLENTNLIVEKNNTIITPC